MVLFPPKIKFKEADGLSGGSVVKSPPANARDANS